MLCTETLITKDRTIKEIQGIRLVFGISPTEKKIKERKVNRREK